MFFNNLAIFELHNLWIINHFVLFAENMDVSLVLSEIKSL